MKMSEATNELFESLAKSQITIANATKNARNLHFRSDYANLAEVLNTVRPALAENGIAIIQAPSFAAGVVTVETMLAHKSGQFVSSCVSTPIARHDAQSIGSATTYLRRYSLASMCGISQEDDDGNVATATKEIPPYPQSDFAENLEKWADAISSGRVTPDQVIEKASGKGTLTEEMKQSIKNLKVKK